MLSGHQQKNTSQSMGIIYQTNRSISPKAFFIFTNQLSVHLWNVALVSGSEPKMHLNLFEVAKNRDLNDEFIEQSFANDLFSLNE